MNTRIFSALFLMVCLTLLPVAGYSQYPQQNPQQMPQQMPMQPMPQQQMQMQQVPPGPLNGMWAANNGQVFALFMGNQYMISNQMQQPIEGGMFSLTGNEMTTQIMQGQGAGQQMRYNFQPGPDGRSFTLTMQNGSGSISYQKIQDLPQQVPMPAQPMPTQPMPTQPMPAQPMPPQMSIPQGQPMPQDQPYPNMQPVPQLPRQ